MGRKKGKQSGKFNSKAEKAHFTRRLQRLVSCSAYDAVSEVENAQDMFYDTENSVFTPTRSAPVKTNKFALKISPQDAEKPTKIDYSKVLLHQFTSSTLIEVCIDVIAKHFSLFEIDQKLDFIPPQQLYRISYAASYYSQLNNNNVEYLFTPEVENLTLHSSVLCEKGLSHLFPSILPINQTDDDNNDIDHKEEDMKFSIGNESIVTTSNVSESLQWFEKEIIPQYVYHCGCSRLIELSICSPIVQASFILQISIHLSKLVKLEFMDTINTDGTAHHRLISALANLKNLELLNLSFSKWFNDDMLIDLIPLLPLVYSVSSDPLSSPSSSPSSLTLFKSKTFRLQTLICKETDVAPMIRNFKNTLSTPTIICL